VSEVGLEKRASFADSGKVCVYDPTGERMPKMKRTSVIDGLAMSKAEFSQRSERLADFAAGLEFVVKELQQAAGRFFGGAADAAADV
jgi:hypothetical protein